MAMIEMYVNELIVWADKVKNIRIDVPLTFANSSRKMAVIEDMEIEIAGPATLPVLKPWMYHKLDEEGKLAVDNFWHPLVLPPWQGVARLVCFAAQLNINFLPEGEVKGLVRVPLRVGLKGSRVKTFEKNISFILNRNDAIKKRPAAKKGGASMLPFDLKLLEGFLSGKNK